MYLKRRYSLIIIIALFVSNSVYAQIDSIAKNLIDSVTTKLIDDDIPKKTFKDKMMYPHRWYTKQLLRPKITDFDTTYITSTKRKLTLTIPFSKKFYGINLKDVEQNSRLKFSPNTYYSVGINFSNVILTFGFASAIKFGSKPNHGNTKNRDLQLTIIGRRVITDINYQNYKGFYINNSNKYNFIRTPDEILIRSDIKAVSFGVSTMFVFNYKKYSLRGAFSFTDTQRKSAASFLTGIYHSQVLFSCSDSTLIRQPFSPYFSTLLGGINKISLITVGVSAGYGYTYVHKKIIFSTAVNVGIGGQKTSYSTIDNLSHSQSLNLSVNLNAKAALRYDNLKFFTGIMSTYENNYTYYSKIFNTETYISKIVVFVGYRFNAQKRERKILKKIGFTDFNSN